MAFFVRSLVGAGLGAALMYLFDPDRGTRRRAMLREQAFSATNRFRRAGESTINDTSQRARGLWSSLRSRWRDEPASDPVLVERLRAAIGRCVSHPGAIDVRVENGDATLSGKVLAEELPRLIDRVHDVPGVKQVTNTVEAYSSADNIPELQGAVKKSKGNRFRIGFVKNHWSPATRVSAGAVALGAMAYGALSRGVIPKIVGGAGFVLGTRAATNLDLVRLTGIRKRYSIHQQKSIRINAPVERVFEVWADCSNFPQFMTHVREVRSLDNGASQATHRWHWKIKGSTGFEVEFDTQTTAYEENRFLAWRSEPNSLVQHAGYVRFQENADRSTTADVRLSYTPPAGAIGHVIAKLFGDDPKSQMDDDLQRMKTFIETGATPRDAAAAGKEQRT